MYGYYGRYIVSADEECTDFGVAEEYPTALGEDGRLGHLSPDDKEGLNPVSHPLPLVDAPDSGRMCIEMTSLTRDLSVSSALFGVCKKHKTPVPLQEYVFMEQEDNNYR